MPQKNILITGGAGFIGSNFITYFLKKYSDYNIINLDKLTYAGKLENVELSGNESRYKFIQGDIQDKSLIESIFTEHSITDVIHFAAESHVDNSISGPEVFVQTNVLGTFILLDTARRHWMNNPFEKKTSHQGSRFHHISTDEVYGSLGDTGYFTEQTAYAPNSPYSASKASADMLVRSYFHTYGLGVVTTNCSNNYGPKQHKEKLIPTIIRKAISGEPIPIYGNGKNVRDWLHVEDHCKGIDKVFHEGKFGETYCIGGNCEKDNLEVAHQVCALLDDIRPQEKPYKELISFVSDRPGHDKRYAIDISKIQKDLSWNPDFNFDEGIKNTIEWYLENEF